MQVCPEDRPTHAARSLKQVMMVVPVDAHVQKTQCIAEKYGYERAQGFEVGSWGALSSSTMIVMMIAMTPSLNASRRDFPISLPSGTGQSFRQAP
jgi:hypothetical protein